MAAEQTVNQYRPSVQSILSYPHMGFITFRRSVAVVVAAAIKRSATTIYGSARGTVMCGNNKKYVQMMALH